MFVKLTLQVFILHTFADLLISKADVISDFVNSSQHETDEWNIFIALFLLQVKSLTFTTFVINLAMEGLCDKYGDQVTYPFQKTWQLKIIVCICKTLYIKGRFLWRVVESSLKLFCEIDPRLIWIGKTGRFSRIRSTWVLCSDITFNNVQVKQLIRWRRGQLEWKVIFNFGTQESPFMNPLVSQNAHF